MVALNFLFTEPRLSDISLKFGISASAIHCWLKKLGFSYKKKPSPMWKQMKKKGKGTKKR